MYQCVRVQVCMCISVSVNQLTNVSVYQCVHVFVHPFIRVSVHMVETYSSMGLVMDLYVTIIVSICFHHVVDV